MSKMQQIMRRVLFHWWRVVKQYVQPAMDQKVVAMPNDHLLQQETENDMESEAWSPSSADKIAELKLEVVNLKASLHELSQHTELPALLAAERALTR